VAWGDLAQIPLKVLAPESLTVKVTGAFSSTLSVALFLATEQIL